MVVVDLGAAPGGWTVIAAKLVQARTDTPWKPPLTSSSHERALPAGMPAVAVVDGGGGGGGGSSSGGERRARAAPLAAASDTHHPRTSSTPTAVTERDVHQSHVASTPTAFTTHTHHSHAIPTPIAAKTHTPTRAATLEELNLSGNMAGRSRANGGVGGDGEGGGGGGGKVSWTGEKNHHTGGAAKSLKVDTREGQVVARDLCVCDVT